MMGPSRTQAYPGMRGAPPNPYPAAPPLPPGPQQSQAFANVGHQVQAGQFPSMTSTGNFAAQQLSQGTIIQMTNPVAETATKYFKEEAKTLGGIQIIIGLMHLFFGVILGLICVSFNEVWGFASTAFIGGYPFWGGVSFIISGSLSVSASKEFSPCLIKGSLGMNIVSAIFALVGMILYVMDMIINNHSFQDYWALVSGQGITAILLIFSLLEFSIACATAHFATQILSHARRSLPSVPNVFAINPFVQEYCPPPRYNNEPTFAPTS